MAPITDYSEVMTNVKAEVIRKRKRKQRKTGKQLMESLGLTSEPKKVQTKIKEKTVEIKEDKYVKKQTKFKVKDFEIRKFGDIFGFTHKNWKGTYCIGGKTKEDAEIAITRYINTCHTDLSWLHLVKHN